MIYFSIENVPGQAVTWRLFLSPDKQGVIVAIGGAVTHSIEVPKETMEAWVGIKAIDAGNKSFTDDWVWLGEFTLESDKHYILDYAAQTLNEIITEPVIIPAIWRVSPCGKLGDIDGDKVVSTLDWELARDYVAGTVTLTDKQIKRGDVDGDGELTQKDADLIYNYIYGLIDTFPGCKIETNAMPYILGGAGLILLTGLIIAGRRRK